MRTPKYSRVAGKDFSDTLTNRVREYFAINNLDPTGGLSMKIKTVLLFGIYASIYLLIVFGFIPNLPLLFVLWFLLGLFQSFVGMSVMHDAVHGAYTKNRFLKLLLEVPVIAIGVEPRIWRIEHNVLHHNYTNIGHIDQDIHPRFVFRFTESQPRRWFHRFQHLYATFFYSLLIIEWLTVKDFVKTRKYYNEGFFKTKADALAIAGMILLKKLLFYFIFLAVPLYVLPWSATVILFMLLTMMVAAGISMTIVFQLAHVVDAVSAVPDASMLGEKNWHVHQLETTMDFAHHNKLLSYLIGGLNYQVEHHLFPGICHIHYPELSKIVRLTAEEFGYPYHYEPKFRRAVLNHYRHLKNLGA